MTDRHFETNANRVMRLHHEELRDGHVQLIKSRILEDIKVGYRYYKIAVNSDARTLINHTLNSMRVVHRGFTRACEAVTRLLNPSFSRSNPQRHDPERSMRSMILPAKKNGQHHAHAFVGVPEIGLRDTVEARIQQHTVERRIQVPIGLSHFADALKAEMHTDNLWIANDRQKAVDEIEQSFGGVDYIAQPTWKEERLWSEVMYLPNHVFRKRTLERAATIDATGQGVQ